MHEKKILFLRLMIVYLLWTAAGVLGGSFLYLYFKNAGVGLVELLASFLFWMIAPLIVIELLNKKKIDLRILLILGVAAQAASYSLVALLEPSAPLLFLCSFLLGTTSFIFWVPFNTMFFELGDGRQAFFGSVYFSVNPVLSVVLPLFGALLSFLFGMPAIFLCAALFSVCLLLTASLAIKGREAGFALRKCLDELKGFKTMIFLEGIYGGGVTASIAVVSVYYFSSAPDLGMFLSVTTLFSVLASIVISKISDASRKRKMYIMVFGSALGIVTIAGSFAYGALAWSALVSARNFIAALFYPFTTAIIMDNKRHVGWSMVGREWLLNWGRVIGILIALAGAIFLPDAQKALLVFGLVMIAYPMMIELKKRHIRVE